MQLWCTASSVAASHQLHTTTPAGSEAQPNAAKLTEAAAAVPLVATAETVLPGEAAGAKSEVALTQVRRFEESGTVPEAASMEGPQAV